MPINTANLEKRLAKLEEPSKMPNHLIHVHFVEEIGREITVAEYSGTKYERGTAESEDDFLSRVDAFVSYATGCVQVVFCH